MITPEFESYIRTMQKYIEGYPVQFSYEGYPWDDFVSETPDDYPIFDHDYWRVKPGKYVWTRLYRTKRNKVAVAYDDSKDCLLCPEHNWLDEPRLVSFENEHTT